MKKKTDVQKTVEEVTLKLLELMGSKAKLAIKYDEDNELVYVNIESNEETGLLIGHHGETLASIQSVISLIVRQKMGEGTRIIVNVGDWREKQEEHLKELARQTVDRVIETKEAQILYNLTPAQRRVIHLELSNHPSVETESQGEDLERYLVVKLKDKTSAK